MELMNLDNLPGKHLVRMYGGSRLYGTNRPDSDIDIRGVMLESPESMFTLAPEFEQYEYMGEQDVTIYGFRKFCKLAAANNPNILELLFCPTENTFLQSYDWRLVHAQRHAFLSQQVRKRYGGYAHSQLKLIDRHNKGEVHTRTHAKFVEQFGYDTKAAAHLMRLVMQCEKILMDGDFNPVLNEGEREMFMYILNGGMTYEQFVRLAEREVKIIDELKSDLPENPNYEIINEVMMGIYKNHVSR